MPGFLEDIDQVRDIEWGRGYLWDIKFPEAPAPFDVWFPAVEVRENLSTISSFTLDTVRGPVKIPQASSNQDIEVTFADDVYHTVLNWIVEWQAEMLGDDQKTGRIGATIATASASAREMIVVKLGLDKEVLKTVSYLVYPEGSVNYQGNSNSEAEQNSVTFVVVGSMS